MPTLILILLFMLIAGFKFDMNFIKKAIISIKTFYSKAKDFLKTQKKEINLTVKLFDHARSFDLGVCNILEKEIIIEARKQPDDKIKWVLRVNSHVLGKDKLLQTEPLPSNRDAEFVELTRFNSLSECYYFWQSLSIKEKELAKFDIDCKAKIK